MPEPDATVEVRAAHRIDATALAAWLADRIPGFDGPIRLRQFAGGQSNPTYLVEAGGRRLVLRKKPPGPLLPSAHQIEREHRVMSALAGTDVPVPKPLALCEDPGVIGTAFYVMEHVDGRVFWDPSLPGLAPEERAAVYDAMNDALARLHRADWQALGLADFGRAGGYVARQIARWTRQYEATRTEEMPAMDRLIAWLPNHVPAREDTAITHGDLRIDNLIFHPTEPRVVAILDWELATLGDPLTDLAYNCMAWHLPNDAPALRGLAGLDRAALGIPSEEDYVAAYCRRTGRRAVPDWNFYLAFAMFRLAAIAQGVHARDLQGNAASANARDVAAMRTVLAERGWERAVAAGA